MRWLDIIILLILIYNIIHGLKNGFVLEITHLIGFFTAFYIASNYKEYFAKNLSFIFNISNENALLLGFPVILIIIYLIFYIIGYFLHEITDLLFISWLDHLAGCLIGAIKGLFIISLTLMILLQLPNMKNIHSEIPKTQFYSLTKKYLPPFVKNLSFFSILREDYKF